MRQRGEDKREGFDAREKSENPRPRMIDENEGRPENLCPIALREAEDVGGRGQKPVCWAARAVDIIVDQSHMKTTEPEECPVPGKWREVSGKEGTVRPDYVYQRHIARCPSRSSEHVAFWASITQLPLFRSFDVSSLVRREVNYQFLQSNTQSPSHSPTARFFMWNREYAIPAVNRAMGEAKITPT